ncbi:hypothetical protein EN836_23015 [Mesorhizobium sp. M1C.F.Ca.ET.193.01.1.1]|uniref:hypothetical protein n=1 Tax=unclassified Mesorhizobium TaxID=325217 RepID=UPI000FD2943E|nr:MULTISPECIES: hypothetical protein [unclassified Mesorhizobium]TGS95551.1 hypothetical protein EN820_43735 [bacterium M00.F.Ca.ET.177.01.1.1]TGQ51628.1 hypothetical protein EN853_23005 [Mesorhizobium sp. M1C.F.Ca.ET.210.01.1.1]TGQ67858.1 hypothetical protein EN855_023015 [Mesorhizobium sp. M1C.F.Ca.ET.212.01.1.1]TGR02447.1 hypothetical protein EN847_23005 [Mesorhizobium sp. M1C.F.Ca.ET.204.01.1.1]TGR23490.1 hypothetical protein EN839_23005 [Mesorhizobium sp. M1C.F.Ca.ET.196.01.1.1]
MPAITRRSLLALTGAAVAIDPASADVRTSLRLQALIAAHEAAYAEFNRVVHRAASSRDDREQADRVEQETLLAVCSFPVISRTDRRTKTKYLLAVEARGELDLPEYIQAILHSMMQS